MTNLAIDKSKFNFGLCYKGRNYKGSNIIESINNKQRIDVIHNYINKSSNKSSKLPF